MLAKLNLLILGCIFLFALPVMASDESAQEQADQLKGSHTARVVVPRAIVYSDENMNSPLGYITNEKLITVGNPRKRNPDLVPLVIYGRLAFIESKNIHFENESIEMLSSKRGAPREHNIDITLSKPEDKLAENNSAYFSFQQFSAGEETKKLANTIDGSTNDQFRGFDISLIHRQSLNRVFWGAGYEYNLLSTSNFKFEFYMLNMVGGYTPVKNSLFLIDLTFAMNFAISTQITITDVHQPSGFMWGPQPGARIVFFPDQKYHAFGAISYRYYNVYGLGSLHDINGTMFTGVTKFRGINLAIGLAIEI